jgi:hypothetical protein
MKDASLGRYQGPELFDARTVDLANLPTVSLQPFNLKRPIESVELHLSFRATVSVAPYASVGVEAPQGVLQRATLRGQHVSYGAQTPFDLSGASAFVYPRHFQRTGGQCFISVNAGPLTEVVSNGVPFASGFTGAIGTHDIRLIYRIPLTPILGASQAGKQQMVNYYLYAKDWQDTLFLEMIFGDASALGDPTGATVALTAFESAAGLPRLETHINYALLGQFRNVAPTPGVVLRTEQNLQGFVTAATQSELLRLQRRITNAIVVKSGVIQTAGLSGGVTTFASLSDAILNRTQVQVDFKPVRRVESNFVERTYIENMMDNAPMQGYFPLLFVESQNALTAYRGDSPSIGSATFAVYSDVLTTDADQRLTVIQEQVIGGTYPPSS